MFGYFLQIFPTTSLCMSCSNIRLANSIGRVHPRGRGCLSTEQHAGQYQGRADKSLSELMMASWKLPRDIKSRTAVQQRRENGLIWRNSGPEDMREACMKAQTHFEEGCNRGQSGNRRSLSKQDPREDQGDADDDGEAGIGEARRRPQVGLPRPRPACLIAALTPLSMRATCRRVHRVCHQAAPKRIRSQSLLTDVTIPLVLSHSAAKSWPLTVQAACVHAGMLKRL